MFRLFRFGSIDLILLLAVILIAAGSRVWYLSVCADNAQKEGPLQVQDSPPNELNALVQNLKEHQQFAGPAPLAGGEEVTAHTAPGYALFLTGIALLPVDLPQDQVVRWAQCGLGALAAACYFLFALRAFSNRWVAALTGLFCALDPFWIINTAEIKDGVLATFLLAACLFLGIRASQFGGPISSLVYGFALAALALVRAVLLPFALVALLWFLLRCRMVRRGWLCGLLAFLGLVIGLSRWTVRDYQTFGDLIPIADSMYVHLWAGNNPQSDGGPQTDATLLETLAQARGADPKELADELGRLGQKERYDQLAADVFRQVQNDPAGTFRRRLEAGLDFLFGKEWFQRGVLWQSTESEETAMPGWLAASYPALLYGTLLGMLTLGLLGWRWTFGWRSEAMLSSLALGWVALPYVLSHAEALQGPRLPLDGILLCYTAFVFVYVIPPIGANLWSGPKQLV
jgi:4-amino-4-deoxy-L-arabinose transferase-like glycosyltransferase